MKKIFLIAEIGINHNGDLSFAKKLIYDAKTAGFDAVKFQKRDINLVYSKEILSNNPDNLSKNGFKINLKRGSKKVYRKNF